MYCELENVNVFYEARGEGTPILTLHGNPVDHRSVLHTMETIFENRPGYWRIYPDMPGVGKTPGAESIQSTTHIMETFCMFIASVIGDQPFLLAGMSFGGYLARGILNHMAERIMGLLLIAPSMRANSEDRTLPAPNVIVKNPDLIATLPESLHAQMDEVAAVHTPKVISRFQSEVLIGLQDADYAFLEGIRQDYALSIEDPASQPTYDKPTLVFMGKQDAVVGYADALALHDKFPRGTFAVLDRAGHIPHIEQEALFNALVHEWLDRVEESRKT